VLEGGAPSERSRRADAGTGWFWVTAMWMVFAALLLGVFIGGVVNQLASVLPVRGAPREPRCPYCGRRRPWWQRLGLIAYLVQRPQCPACGASIGIRWPLVEIGLGLTYGYLWITLGPSIRLVLYSLYSAIFALLLVTDVEFGVIPNAVTFPAIILGFAASLLVSGPTWWRALLGGTIGLTFFTLAASIGSAVLGSEVLGQGDFTLAALVGLVTGYPLVIEAIVITILIGGLVSLVLLITRRRSLTDYVPYGSFMAAGAMITLLWGHGIAEWFLP
jgi:leader peptidase (prepilin peptidase)/N-methyltransferase